MIRPVLALAYITVRQAWHARAIVWLLAAGLLSAVVLPFVLTSGGDPATTATMIATYTPPLVFAVMLTGAIWLGCASLATERSQQQLAMLRTKPIGGLALWCGKWLGINIICLFVLLVSGCAYQTTLHLRQQQIGAPAQSVWQPFAPDESELIETARRHIEQWRNVATDPSLVPSLRQERNRLRQQAYQSRAGDPITWHIPIQPTPPAAAWKLQFQFRLDPMQRAPICGTWVVSTPTDQNTLGTYPIRNRLDGTHRMALPGLTVPPHTPAVSVRFIPQAPHPHIFFDTETPIQLLARTSSPLRNLLRAGLVLFACMAALSAASILLGSCLSFAVAVFSTHAFLLALLIASVAQALDIPYGHAHAQPSPLFMQRLLQLSSHVLSAIQSAASAVQALLPFDALAHGYLIRLAPVRVMLVVLLLGVPAACGALTAWRMSRQEVAS